MGLITCAISRQNCNGRNSRRKEAVSWLREICVGGQWLVPATFCHCNLAPPFDRSCQRKEQILILKMEDFGQKKLKNCFCSKLDCRKASSFVNRSQNFGVLRGKGWKL